MIKRYVQTRNRDGDVVLTEDKGQNFLEWPRYVLASDFDSAVAALKEELEYLHRAHDVTLCSVEDSRLQRDDLHDEVEKLRQAVLDEREACARVCEELRDEYLENDTTIDADDFPWDALWKGAIAIRARGENP